MNKAILIGRLTKDPESKSFQSGATMATFTLAVDRRFANKETGKRETDFINIVCWRQQAEFSSRYLTKGRKVAVVGQIQTRSYDAQDGTKRYVTEIVADEVEALGGPSQGAGRSADEVPPPQEPSGFSAGKAGGFVEADDDELPF